MKDLYLKIDNDMRDLSKDFFDKRCQYGGCSICDDEIHIIINIESPHPSYKADLSKLSELLYIRYMYSFNKIKIIPIFMELKDRACKSTEDDMIKSYYRIFVQYLYALSE